ncbi:MAG: PAS domain S-box protein, partial [Gammaproteobacteria bacterium]|nr:PAS domain S-box protein [Gammaproteobacteria bacterium]
SGCPAAFVAAPILREGKLIGVVALQVGSGKINEMVKDYSGLGKTGEIVVASKDGDKVVFVMPLRYDPDAAFRKKLAIGNGIALPLQNAANGSKGRGECIDYSGKEVLAVWRFLPDLRWGVVVKIDKEEVFASVARFRYKLLIVGVITLISALFLAFFISRSISRPIRKMVEMFLVQEKANVDLQKEINERLLAEKQVRMLSFAIEQSPVSIAITDTKGNIEYVNRKFAQTKGGADEMVVDQDVVSQKTDVNVFGDYKELWQTISSGKEWQGEFSNKSKEGATSWEFASISPVRDVD